MEKKPFHEKVEEKNPQGIKAIFAHAINTLWNVDHSNQNFQECIIYLENAADAYKKQVDFEAFANIRNNRELISAGFVKDLESDAYKFEINNLKRVLIYDPFNKTYTLNQSDGSFIAEFVEKRAKSAIYFANNIL